MDEQHQNTPDKQEKRLSRTTLTFYIIGLCSVAIALILVSYILQARTDRQLDSLTTKLSEQQTVAQGATQKMADLQKQFDLLSDEIAQIRQTLNATDGTKLTEAVQKLLLREQLLESLLAAEEAARSKDQETLTAILDELTTTLSPEQRKPQSEGGLLEDKDYAIYQALTELAKQLNTENTGDEDSSDENNGNEEDTQDDTHPTTEEE